LRRQRTRPTVSLEQEDAEQRELTLGSRIPDVRPGPEEAYARKERFEILEGSLKNLPPPLQSAVWLRDVEGLSTAEAARALGLSEGTVKSQLHRARNKLSSLVRPGQTLRGAPAAACAG
jgi:RNA polymerase sigma factor (sigma-70 family)